MAALPKIEIGGQLLFNAPGHCSFCGYCYLGRGRRRVLINDWFETREPRSREIKHVRGIIRLCTANDRQSHGCVEMGFRRLLTIHRS